MLRGLLAVGILGWCLSGLGDAWSGVDRSLLVFEPGGVLLAAGAGAAGLLTLALVSAAGVRAAGLGQQPGFWLGWIRVWFVGYFYRYVPGKVMLVVERTRLGATLGVPASTSVLLVVWESLLLLAGAGLAGSFGLLLRSPSAENLVSVSPVSISSVLALTAAALAGTLLLGPTLRTISRRWPELARRLPALLLEVPGPAQLLLVLGNSLAWMFLGLSFSQLAGALSPGEPPPMSSLLTWFIVSYVGGQLASVAPAGLGVREALLVAGLADLASAPLALAWAVAHRILLSTVELILVLGSLLLPLPTRDTSGLPDTPPP